MSIQRVAIIGAGQMGSGIAHVFALAGYDVLLNDISVDRIEAGIASITGNLNRQAAKSKITEAEREKAAIAGLQQRIKRNHEEPPAAEPAGVHQMRCIHRGGSRGGR